MQAEAESTLEERERIKEQTRLAEEKLAKMAAEAARKEKEAHELQQQLLEAKRQQVQETRALVSAANAISKQREEEERREAELKKSLAREHDERVRAAQVLVAQDQARQVQVVVTEDGQENGSEDEQEDGSKDLAQESDEAIQAKMRSEEQRITQVEKNKKMKEQLAVRLCVRVVCVMIILIPGTIYLMGVSLCVCVLT